MASDRLYAAIGASHAMQVRPARSVRVGRWWYAAWRHASVQ